MPSDHAGAPHRGKPARARLTSGYAKSLATRRAILRAAIAAFGRRGFSAVTTREIASAAGVNQPAINYHFGGKEGLYQACAQEILDRFVQPLGQVSQRSAAALAHGLDRRAAARELEGLLSALADVMILSREVSEAADFVHREMREPGLAYSHLYNNLWSPGTELAARLVAAVKGRPRAHECDRIDAIMLISGIAAFVPGSAVAMDILRWQEAGEAGKALVLERLKVQIQAWVH
ncbi:MAG: CerR family C-terminal domain-containing protein [Pseudomonadota bacterium]